MHIALAALTRAAGPSAQREVTAALIEGATRITEVAPGISMAKACKESLHLMGPELRPAERQP